MNNISEQQYRSGELDLYYDITGTTGSHNIICIHGLASNASRWHEFMLNTRLQQQAQILAPDLRGHGRSMTRSLYQRADWCNDIDQLIRQFATPCTMIGHSLGAQVVLEYANRHADKLSGMILIDPVFPQALSGSLKKVARMRHLLWLAIMLLHGLQVFGIYKRRFPPRSLMQLDIQTRRFLADNPDKSIADLYMNPLADLAHMPLVNYLQDLFEVTRRLPELHNINIPTLVLLSQGASTSNVAENRKILGNLTDCEISPIEADHWLLTEKPVEAREAIEAWFEKHKIIK